MLRALYILSDGSHSISESMVAGTVAGELSFLSRTKRNTNVVAERDSVLWKMDVDAHERMGKELGWPTARKFEEMILKIAVAETEVLMVRPATSHRRPCGTAADFLCDLQGHLLSSL